MSALKKWATDTLYADATFTALCTSKAGSALNFYRSSPMNRIMEDLPYFTAYSDSSEGDFQSQADYARTWVIPMSIAIAVTEKPITDTHVTVWESTDKVEELAEAAVEVLRTKAVLCGINTEDIRVLRYNIFVTEIGEADDVQANLFITFGKMNLI